MTHVRPQTLKHQTVERPALYQVWIDMHFGRGPADWWWNTPPKPLSAALAESARCRRDGWIVRVFPEGVNPRLDGRWDNP